MTHNEAGKYFILFFDAMHRVPGFNKTMRDFYIKMKKLLMRKWKVAHKENNDEAENAAIRCIAQLEGMLFWQAVFPEDDASGAI